MVWYRFYTRLDLDRWLLLALIGVCVGLIATLLKQSIEALDALQWNRTKSYLRVCTNVRPLFYIFYSISVYTFLPF